MASFTKVFSSSLLSLALISSVGFLTACQKKKQDTPKEEQAENKESKKDAKKAKLTSKALPADWPADLALPKNFIVTDIKREAVQEEVDSDNDNTEKQKKAQSKKKTKKATLVSLSLLGQVHANLSKVSQSLHADILDQGWKANIVIPQASNTLMQYHKDDAILMIDLISVEAKNTGFKIIYTSPKLKLKTKS